MANRPIFVPQPAGFPFVQTVPVEFTWYPGFALSQAQKSIAALHAAAAGLGYAPLLEISSKSPDPLGVELSAFNLQIATPGGERISVECAFQGSKVFEQGGPYTDLYWAGSRAAKRDERLRASDRLIAFDYFGRRFPTQPLTAFYDWLYLTALTGDPDLSRDLPRYAGFSDIAFNPEKSLNCQARSAALYVALHRAGRLGADLWELVSGEGA